ncbi:hypothetical protein TIFTF001_054367 [Ficus carica]|uniref:Uncharacterized protein n=1 Tax=Ficus carica TaxID=3494 RepID=A0AA88ENF6_FICCA|nr:hypothetical protein TIFTF001_054367 [Ficus carica]
MAAVGWRGAPGARGLGGTWHPWGASGALSVGGAWAPVGCAWRPLGGGRLAPVGGARLPLRAPERLWGRARRKNPSDPNVEGKRRATIMKRVHMARKKGERIPVMFDEKGQPEGKHGDELMSWIGVLAQEHIPIWIQDWRSRDLDGLKDIIWKETITSFTADESFWTACIKSCGEAAQNFRHDLYKTFVEGFLKEESVWTRSQKVVDIYPNIEEEDWVKFVQYRTSSQFQQLSDRGSEIRTNNEYSSRGGRDGYRKLD